MSRDRLGITCHAEETVASWFFVVVFFLEYFYCLICIRTKVALGFNCSHLMV